MIVEKLTLKQFRNYERISVDFKEGINIILGQNGAGKTNLAEAIYYLSFARSFRTLNYRDLIMKDKDFASIEALVRIDDETKQIKMVLTEEGQKITCNKVEINKLSALADLINVIVFEPKDVGIFQASPRQRRSFLNMQLSKLSSKYLDACSNCARLTKERNAILKSTNPNKVHLEVVTKQLIEESYEVCLRRKEFITTLEPLINKTLSAISLINRKVTLKYNSYVEFDSKEDYIVKAQKAFKDTLENDLKYKVTTIGVHHEDFSTYLNGAIISNFGSQGEKRIVAIALKIAPYFLVEDRTKRPIVVLDDVLSELDQTHQNKMISFLEKFAQVFITGTHINENYKVTIYDVANQNILRRNTHGR
ncbi:MAG: DNA replication and repair protein RecF [Erysipelotrichales bacterium]|nr:DNA replication and repair protein RecF [Erysipelotrichales bacterium]